MQAVNQQETQATQIGDQLDEMLERASRAENSLYSCVNRLAGSMPATPEVGTEIQEKPEGFIPSVSYRLNRLTHVLRSMEESIDRLQKTV